jgi:hypothetical protein
MKDKLIVVYEGSYAQYRGDWLKDEYVNKLVIVTGEQSSTSAEERKSYLCVSNGEKSVAIPIPSVCLQGIMVDNVRYGYTDGYIRFAKANGIDLSFDVKTGDLSIGISEDVENTLGTLNTTITQVSKKADNAVSQAESATTKADEAKTTATEAKTTANSVSAQMSGVLTQVQNNATQIGIIAKDYLRKDQAADFATDLTGVVEATAEEFVYRPSAGEKSIRDKSAVIRRIKGNSVVWEQKIQAIPKRENFEGATTYYDYDTNECVVQNISRTSNYTSGSTRLEIKPDYYSVPNHVYLLLSDKHYKGIGVHSYTSGFQNVNTIKRYTTIDDINFRIDKTFDWVNVCPVGSEIRLRMMFFDLTAMFGDGNEPATVEEFRKVYNEAYYPYCQPELRGVKTGAIKTVGFNLFDGNCARVIGGMTYIVSNYAAAYYSETKDGTQTTIFIKDGVYTPECSGYLYLEGTADATPCVHFQHSGVMDGECAPYVEHILNLPEILKLFPNGMHAVGDVFDEINIDSYIQRCRYRDYVEGDENNADVLTDGVHTVAKLAEPIITPLSEPITLDYYCEDWGTEEAISSSSSGSAPFRADIVYQFNAEGRIRDNSRNIDRLEKIVAPLQNIPPRDPLATQSFVLSTIPTEVATATERIKMYEGQSQLLKLSPNVMYDWTGGGSLLESITIPPLYINTETIGTYDHKWMVRVGSGTSDKVTIPFDVLWKDGIAPNWTSWCICEITFKCDAQQDEAMRKIIGEWTIYR